MSRIGLLILAAGASTRLGQPKQLLNLHGKPLVRHMAEMAIATNTDPIGIVLGANAGLIHPLLTDLPIHPTENDQWATGMASSIRCGLRKLLTLAPDLEAIVLLVCDQPFVSTLLIQQLITAYQTSQFPIIASAYAETLGVPALFHRRLFPELLALEGDCGAKALIHRYALHCRSIPFAAGAIDLDTPDNLETLASLMIPPQTLSF